MFSALNHAMDLSSIMSVRGVFGNFSQANVVLMEYPEFGIYSNEDSDSDSVSGFKTDPFNYTRCTTPASKSALMKSKQDKGNNSILKQIYRDWKTVLKYIIEVGEVVDRRVIL